MDNKLVTEKRETRENILEILSQLILRYSDLIKALKNLNKKSANSIIENSNQIDLGLDDVEAKIILAINLYQPIARDLRELIAYMKVTSSLYRINELISHICITICRISNKTYLKTPLPFFDNISSLVLKSLKQAKSSFKSLNKKKIEELISIDKAINLEYRSRLNEFIKILESEGHAKTFLRLIGIDKSFERIGDLTKKAANDLLYIF